ncbi:MAG: hypothetical protein A2W31_15620 [Planctomycetes bacterium RBG_16_64_10]|nr:MAG: hypothetical protein A2W31_15620 [Planctomycetes bacterium RBG_16_64_10]
MFLLTSMPVGGAETLLVSLVGRLSRARFAPELCCLKELGPLGQVLACQIPAHCGLLAHKYDGRVLPRLVQLLRRRRIDILITVGAGDKMFWGRLAARLAGVPVVLCAVHSTGWPDRIGRLNRLLTGLTDGFIAVADAHGRYLVECEGFPAPKVHVIRNGVDTQGFARRSDKASYRAALGLPPRAPVVGIVAALRPEKNHALFLRGAGRVLRRIPTAQFVVVGDGPQRTELARLAAQLGIDRSVHFLGTRTDIPDLLAALDVFAITSDAEANPVSILEAMSAGLPVVATQVGSVSESVGDGKTGYLVPAGAEEPLAARLIELLAAPRRARAWAPPAARGSGGTDPLTKWLRDTKP